MLEHVAPAVAPVAPSALPAMPWGTQQVTPYTVLSAQELYPRICVRDPYFALKDVTVLAPGEVVARVPVQLAPEAEAMPISLAESGRHLAILGSCASALVAPKDGQHFYLACAARGQWLEPRAQERASDMLWALAQAEYTGKRTATARTLLSSADGTPLFKLEVDYNVLSAAAFTRLFGAAKQEMRSAPRPADTVQRTPEEWAKLRQNPYSKPLDLRDWQRDGASLRANLGTVTPEMCKGHFAMHPVMPVAIVASGMTRVATSLARALEGAPEAHFVAKDVKLSADSLAYAGQDVVFGASRTAVDGANQSFSCWAAVGERVVAQLEVTYCRVD
ncbi:hypothetical protein DRW03_20535 [Corallococcus sp. H22C18031201]|uniref:hypothetical protein n=1 Tax=Citreicoccus inhibens TaxID=2849499 RepID=UPI000E7247D9|nr:hypothetical protein [Citreicoccus inhibens]MBU8895722.1 hypothetical protein [Citreicoccus inhibens]RJS20145.1 hypothetical protein DRW03_20535 [Corallococcus sp. H22C18031201]